ncbi:thioredoxin family protein [uncultured Flavobacterium sp.]|uniref:thioredoxin family protein n=1 Tax=uncultured Flavobacterium sp. TaxID=165435 RepID=UPI0025F2B733|nr:thioredoxin family protein [uncultured Flavobacterium sp.]
MEKNKNTIALVIRGIIAFLFLLSAVAKIYPSPYFAITTFEVKQLYSMGFSETTAAYFSRTLIGIEFALGLLILQRNYLRKLVIPATILMLVVFIIHLTIDTIANGNSGSCGCFGELLPMTPVEAIIKNVISVALLVWLYKLIPAGTDKKNFWILTTVTFACVLGIFMAAPIQPKTADMNVNEPVETRIDTVSAITPATDTTSVIPVTEPTKEAVPATTEAIKPEPVAVQEPPKTKSMYSQYFASADKGKKIIGLFAPGCDHCQETAKILTQMRAKNKDLPELLIIFMDEEAEKIPEFFQHAGAQYPYKLVDVITFWKLIENGDTPGIVFQWNGKKIKMWDGINEKEFKSSELLNLYKKPYAELK